MKLDTPFAPGRLGMQAAGLAILALGGLLLGAVQVAQGAPDIDSHTLLTNADFTDWSDGLPSDWSWRNSNPNVTRPDEQKLGKPVIAINESNAIVQTISDPPLREGDRVVFEGFMRTDDIDMTMTDILLRYPDGEEPDEPVREILHIPSGDWQFVRIMLRVPKDDPESVRFAVHMYPDVESPLFLSGLRAYVIPGIP